MMYFAIVQFLFGVFRAYAKHEKIESASEHMFDDLRFARCGLLVARQIWEISFYLTAWVIQNTKSNFLVKRLVKSLA